MKNRTVRTSAWSVAAVLALLLLGYLAFVYTGVYNVAATEPHTGLGEWTLETVLENAVARRADGVGPVPAFDSSRVQAGFEHFRASCVTCHGAPGMPKPDYASHMTPEPPALSEAVQEWSDQELFWIVKNGIKMSGMPAWGPLHDEDQLWDMVAFIRQLPQMDSLAYARMEEAAASTDGHEHDHSETGSH